MIEFSAAGALRTIAFLPEPDGRPADVPDRHLFPFALAFWQRVSAAGFDRATFMSFRKTCGPVWPVAVRVSFGRVGNMNGAGFEILADKLADMDPEALADILIRDAVNSGAIPPATNPLR